MFVLKDRYIPDEYIAPSLEACILNLMLTRFEVYP